MKAFLATAALMLAAVLPASAAMPAALPAALPAAIDQDPLMKQILAKQLTLPNGGVTAAVAVRGARAGIELQIPDPLAPLAPAAGLAEGEQAPAKKTGKKRGSGRPAAAAREQVETLEAAGPVASFERAAK